MISISQAIKIAQRLAKMRQGLECLKHNTVYVGIPKQTNKAAVTVSTAKDGSPTVSKLAITNAQLLYIHHTGIPARNVPARPVLDYAFQKQQVKQQITQQYGDALRAAMKGDVAGVKAELQAVGILATNAVKNQFGQEPLAPNAPSTIERKGSSAPLIDSGNLRNNITYVVREE